MSKHSQAPWRVEFGTFDSIYIVNHEDLLVCELDPDAKPSRKEEIKANAALIAQAPKLLAVCKALMSHLEYRDTLNFTRYKPHTEEIEMLRNIIKESEGE